MTDKTSNLTITPPNPVSPPPPPSFDPPSPDSPPASPPPSSSTTPLVDQIPTPNPSSTPPPLPSFSPPTTPTNLDPQLTSPSPVTSTAIPQSAPHLPTTPPPTGPTPTTPPPTGPTPTTSPSPAPTAPVSPPPSRSKLPLFILLFIIIASLIAAAIYLFLNPDIGSQFLAVLPGQTSQPQTSPDTDPSPSPTTRPNPSPLIPAGWQNHQLDGYSIALPSIWQQDTQYQDSTYPNATRFILSATTPPSSEASPSATQNHTDFTVTVSDAPLRYPDLTDQPVSNLTINNYPGQQQEGYGGPSDNIYLLTTWLESPNGRYYNLTLTSQSSLEETELHALYQQILSTFHQPS